MDSSSLQLYVFKQYNGIVRNNITLLCDNKK